MAFRRIAGHLSGYCFATMVTAAAAFLCIPLLTRLLGLNEFGRYALLEPLQIVLSLAVLAGANYGVVKQVVYDRVNPVPLTGKVFVWSHLVMAPLFMLCMGGMITFRFSIAETVLFGMLTYLEAYFLLLQAAFRASSCVRGFLAGTIIKALLLVVLAVLYAGSIPLTIQGLLMWRITTVAAGCFVGYIFLIRHIKSYSDGIEWHEPPPDASRAAVRYGFPILATGLLALVIEFADRYILKSAADYTTIARYLIYLKIGACLGPLIITPFNLWWGAERFERLRSPDGGRVFFAQTAAVVLVAFACAGSALWIVSPLLIRFFAPGVPDAPLVVGMLLLSVVAMGMAAPLNIGLLNEGKTHLNILAAVAGAATNLLLCWLLIPANGITGAAAATCFSYIVYTFTLNVLSQRVYPVPFAYPAMALYSGAIIGALLIGGIMAPDSGMGSMAARLAAFFPCLVGASVVLLRKVGIPVSVNCSGRHLPE